MASYTPPKPKLVIIHCGYKLAISEEVKKKIHEFLPDAKINEEPITAIHYMAGHDMMSSWYSKHSKKPIVAYLHGLYINERLKHAIGHFTVDGVHTWVILSKGTQISPGNLKKEISAGRHGPEIVPDTKLTVVATAYKYEDYYRRGFW